MIILKCTVPIKKVNLFKNININKFLCGDLDNNLMFKFYNRLIHSNIKFNNMLLELVNENLSCRTCKTDKIVFILFTSQTTLTTTAIFMSVCHYT